MTTTGALAKKLAEVMGVANRIPKRGRNDFHKYDYATEADIAEAIRGELASRHVVLIPSVESYEVREIPSKKAEKESRYVTYLSMTFTFQDGDTGEEILRRWVGAGEDSGDKGVYKAMTGAEKYFLLKTFLMPTGDDPEAESDQKKPKPVKVETIAPKVSVAVPQGASLIQKTEQLETSAKKPYWQFVLAGGETLMTWKEGIGAMAEQACQNGQPVRVQVRGEFEDMGVVQSMTLAETKKANGKELTGAEIFNQTVPAEQRPL